MNLKKGILIKLGILISLLVVNVTAVTPGSTCRINIYQAVGPMPVLMLSAAGTVSADGTLCIPTPPIPPENRFAGFNSGTTCNTTRLIGIGFFGIGKIETFCPN
jgi:hypothetical protein